jgi:hypothetical protein
MGPHSGRSNLAGEHKTRMVYAKSKKLKLKNWEQTIDETRTVYAKSKKLRLKNWEQTIEDGKILKIL